MATCGIALVFLMVILTGTSLGSAKVYTVGDKAGWALGVDYTTWASDKTFKVGDSLVFNYDTSHTVDLVSSGDYTTCTVGNSIASYKSGTTSVSLNTTGSKYFICGVMGHCDGGMKLTIVVTGDGSPSASPTPSPIAADSPTTIPTGTAQPQPTVSGTSNIPVVNSSAAVSRLVAVGFCLVAFLSQLILG